MNTAILTYSGNLFDYINPHASQFNILDIAHGLSKQSRFSGQTKDFYSVAQHSVIVSHLVPEEDALKGLLHDAPEAFLGDVPSPLKQLLPDYKKLEESIEKVVFNKYGFEHLPKSVKEADKIALVTEKRDLCNRKNYGEYSKLFPNIKPSSIYISPLSWENSKQIFLQRFVSIIKKDRLRSARR